jgi:EAL domain-containing protein (putative c-di-GMP-specific phosphodiesterase class I)
MLKEAGICIAIDDVGFGRSCLESLIILEPDIVKVDKRWVNGIAKNNWCVRSLERLLKVAGALGTTVVAEGIENPEDLQVLKTLGVSLGQGYLLGRPA